MGRIMPKNRHGFDRASISTMSTFHVHLIRPPARRESSPRLEHSHPISSHSHCSLKLSNRPRELSEDLAAF